MKRASQTQPLSQAQTRSMFQRTLNGWVVDNLKLGRAGLERPSARGGAAQRGAGIPRQGLWDGLRAARRAG
jgi:hypothetical protein